MTHYRIVDVCGTLVKDDTTLGLLRWHFARERRWRLRLLQAATARWSPIRLLVGAAEKATGRHLLKHAFVRLLKGDAADEIAHSASGYADWLLAQRRVDSVMTILRDEEPDGELVLASASLEPVVQALAERLGAIYVASRLVYSEGRCTGMYGCDLTGQKVAALDGVLAAGWLSRPYTAISDNLTDRPLLEGAGHAYVVLHAERHRARWRGLNAEYLFA